jgi:hypothetical protein
MRVLTWKDKFNWSPGGLFEELTNENSMVADYLLRKAQQYLVAGSSFSILN